MLLLNREKFLEKYRWIANFIVKAFLILLACLLEMWSLIQLEKFLLNTYNTDSKSFKKSSNKEILIFIEGFVL